MKPGKERSLQVERVGFSVRVSAERFRVLFLIRLGRCVFRLPPIALPANLAVHLIDEEAALDHRQRQHPSAFCGKNVQASLRCVDETAEFHV